MRVMWVQLACRGWGADEVGAGTEARGAGDVAVGDAGAAIGVHKKSADNKSADFKIQVFYFLLNAS